MKVQLTTILIICIEHLTKAIAQGMPVSPCPKIFQYRFDGSEWFGLIAVRNPDIGQALQIRVILSMRGKPTTHYLGEIELLTRGQFVSNTPVLYKVRFPKHHFPPKLVQISANNQVICFGSADHSIFMTQIQLEHIRKLTFIPDKQTSGIMGRPPLMMGEIEMPAGKELPMPASHEFGSKPLPHIHFKKKPFHSPKEICGTIDRSVNFHLPSHARSLNDRKKSSLKSASSVGGLAGNDDDEFNAADVSHSPTFASLSDYDSDDIDFEKEENHSQSQSQSQSQSPVEQTAADTTLFMDNGNASAGVVTLPSITRGAWPWLAAIYVNNLTSLDYQCGGTLVSTRVVISSAHCFQMFNKRYTANEVLVFLGRHNLKNWNEEGSLAAPVDGIYIHPDYNSQLSTYDADIAVILLKDEVRFNTFIRPVCLWSGSSKSEYIVGEHGIVIGWSFNRMNISGSSHKHSTASKSGAGAGAGAISENSSTPKVVEAPIVSNEECFKANAHFRSLSSNRTFCASILLESKLHIPRGKGSSRSSACQRFENSGLYTGISGAGLMIHKNQRWMLRGTVSAALPPVNGTDTANKAHQCNRHKYLIYTDVAKFIDWIMAFII